MGVFHVFQIVEMVPNRAKHHILLGKRRSKLLLSKAGYSAVFSSTQKNVDSK